MDLDALYVVGVGASAGGLESLERFFRSIPAGAPLAFVVVQHLSPSHKSLMPELIRRFTPLSVHDAAEGTRIAPGCIYVLTAGTEVEVRRDELAVMDRDSQRALAFPIDRMFSSLADAYGPNAIAVVLSGSGSDGSRGILSIDRAGGLVLAEDPAIATFDGMPRAAVDTGVVSATLGAETLGQFVVEHARGGGRPNTDDLSILEEILAILKTQAGDFGDYRRGTIYRRVMRRMLIVGATNMSSYLHTLVESPTEAALLHDDLLIGVTSFFRDPRAFSLLEAEIQALVANPIGRDRELRAWCAGCASGEEAYTISILFDEAIERLGEQRDYKVFATDIHGGSLETAGLGVFAEERLANVDEQRRSKYFTRRADGKFRVDASLRNHVVFARHDVLKDTPFTNLDLVSCRNLLIYLNATAQHTALSALAYGLRIGGVLFLGSSESLGGLVPHFTAINESERLFRKSVHSRAMIGPRNPARLVFPAPHIDHARHEARLLPIYDAVLEAFMPPAFLLSEQRTLIDSYGNAERLLRVGKRRPTGDFLELVPPPARPTIAGLLARAQREQESPPPSPLMWEVFDAEPRHYNAKLHRLTVRNGEPVYVLALLERGWTPGEPDAAAEAVTISSPELEAELAHARMTLQATLEDLEASNQELQAANEELVASNEELQSVNEELQSVNEELHTINAEHQHKITELTELNRDIGHLLQSIDVATIYLDVELRIRKYTPRAAELFRLVEHDVGRYLASFNHQLHYPTLMDDVRAVLREGTRVEKEVRGHDERWYFIRLLPYRVGAGIEGVVVTLTDASALASAKARARQLSSIVESIDDAIIGMTLDGMVTSWNDAARRLYGYTAEEMVDQSMSKLVVTEEREALRQVIARIAAGERLINIAVTRLAKSGRMLEIAKTMSPVLDGQGTVVGIATIDRDIQAQKELERRLRESESRYEDLYHNAPDLYLTVNLRTDRLLEGNETLMRVTGFRRDQIRSRTLEELFAVHERSAVHEAVIALRSGIPVSDLGLELRTAAGEPLHVTMSATIIHAHDGSPVGARVVLRDVSIRHRAELELGRATTMREQVLAELRSTLHVSEAAFQLRERPGSDAAAQARWEAIVHRQTRQMARLHDLLEISRALHGKLSLDRRPIDLVELVRAAVDMHMRAFATKAVDLELEGFDSRLPLVGDGARLVQVFDELLDNALRYTPAGKRVIVTVRRDGLECEVRVTDEGRGLEADELESILDVFTSARLGSFRNAGNLGLGLMLAERITTAHGGSIAVTSTVPGATFVVRLALDARASTRPEPSPRAARPLRIVLVEDREDAREMLTMMLEAEGHTVESTSDGEHGLAMIRAARPDVALIDVGLPKAGGYALASAVRKELARETRLIALWGQDQPDDIRRAKEAGFERQLAKPLDPQRLCDALRDDVR